MRLLICGHSHTDALFGGACRLLADGGLESAAQVLFPLLPEEGCGVRLCTPAGGRRPLARFPDFGRALTAAGTWDLALILPAGRQVVTRACVNPFEPFAVAGEGAAPPSARLIPSSLVEHVYRESLATAEIRDSIAAVIAHRRPDAAVVILGPPPPLAPADIETRLATTRHLPAMLAASGTPVGRLHVADVATLQYLHRSLLRAYEELAADVGVEFAGPPTGDAVDADGSLRADFSTHDFIHVSPIYGRRYVEAVLDGRPVRAHVASV